MSDNTEALKVARGLLREALAWIENSTEPAPSLCSDIRKFITPAAAVQSEREDIESLRDQWKIVDGDCRDDGEGLITYHVAAFDEGYRAGIAAVQVSQWMPIDTAPKDGSEIWAFNGEQQRMKWIEGDGYALWAHAEEVLSDIDPESDQPTHWMPLPPIPIIPRRRVMTETDRELLELAARAAGWKFMPAGTMESVAGWFDPSTGDTYWVDIWNPLRDDGDRLRLCRTLGISIDFSDCCAWKRLSDGSLIQEFWGGDYGDEAHAVLRAAAAIGKEK